MNVYGRAPVSEEACSSALGMGPNQSVGMKVILSGNYEQVLNSGTKPCIST